MILKYFRKAMLIFILYIRKVIFSMYAENIKYLNIRYQILILYNCINTMQQHCGFALNFIVGVC